MTTSTSVNLPKTNREFWETKIKKNIERDRKNIDQLRKEGWKVIVVWDCEMRNSESRDRRLASLLAEIDVRR
jgi:DNA mismatch endonuclease (patch repair protein)